MGYHPGWFADGIPLLVFRDKLCSRSGSDPFLKWVYLRPVAIIVIITQGALCVRDRCNPSWAIIKGRITMPEEELIGVAEREGRPIPLGRFFTICFGVTMVNLLVSSIYLFFL